MENDALTHHAGVYHRRGRERQTTNGLAADSPDRDADGEKNKTFRAPPPLPRFKLSSFVACGSKYRASPLTFALHAPARVLYTHCSLPHPSLAAGV